VSESARFDTELKKILDNFYETYNFQDRLQHDPVSFPLRYKRPEDAEIAGFIASCFAYGRVGHIKPFIESILSRVGKDPSGFLKKFSLNKDSNLFQGLQYRFNKEDDIICLAFMLGKVLHHWGSLKNLFYHYYDPAHITIRPALTSFVQYFYDMDTSAVYGTNRKPDSLLQLFPSPQKGSACKRMNLFLRWMIRTGDIDLGIWDHIPPSKLIIPLDTHIAKISKCLGLTGRISSDWKTAEEITASLKQLDPHDPLKYDFALCHQGISGLCKGEESVLTCTKCTFHSMK
jgi:uncharacterized protein (TIGR02757 family)